MTNLPPSWKAVTIAELTVACEQQIPAADEFFQYIDISSIDRETKTIVTPQTLLGKDAPSRARKHVRVGDVHCCLIV